MRELKKYEQPIYADLTASFQKDLSLPETGLVAPAALVWRADKNLAQVLTQKDCPQIIMLEIQAELNLLDRQGRVLTDLRTAIKQLGSRAVPAFVIHDEETAAYLISFLHENRLADAFVVTPYATRALVKQVYEGWPYLRGVIDLTASPCLADKEDWPALLAQNNASVAILPAAGVKRSEIRYLQRRLCGVWLETDQALDALTSGSNGIVSDQYQEIHDLYSLFPANSILKTTNLYAHRGLHIGGIHPENSLAAIEAALAAGLDGVEIDVHLTVDDELVVCHDASTGSLFDKNLPIQASSLADLRALRYKDGSAGQMATFAEVLLVAKNYPQAVLIIEIKAPDVIKAAQKSREIILEKAAQAQCVFLKGPLLPSLGHLRKSMPQIPAGFCVDLDSRAFDQAAASERLSWLSQRIAGWNAGYSTLHSRINRLFAQLASLRGYPIFPWANSFTGDMDEDYLSGYDGLTINLADLYMRLPVKLHSPSGKIVCYCQETKDAVAGYRPQAECIYRDGSRKKASQLSVLVLQGQPLEKKGDSYLADQTGETVLLLRKEISLSSGKVFSIYSDPVQLEFVERQEQA